MAHNCPSCLCTIDLLDDFDPGDSTICDRCGTVIVYRESGIFTQMDAKALRRLSYEAKLQIEKVRNAIKDKKQK